MSTLVVALGNPGNEYLNNRHNIGRLILEHLPFFSSLGWQKKFNGFFSQTNVSGEKVYFLMPETYMNLSGKSVAAAAKFFKVEVQDILVIHDELDLDYGVMSFKNGGGLAGHNGLKSIKECLGSQDFLRLRLGIGRPSRGDVASWVLSDFKGEEADFLGNFLGEAAKGLEYFFDNGPKKSMNEYNTRKLI